jgi:ferredoxin
MRPQFFLQTRPVTEPPNRSQEESMKAHITEDCISCGQCVEICPNVFEMGEDIARVKNAVVPKEEEDRAREAAEACPVDAIILED